MINLGVIEKNARKLAVLCHENGVRLVAVTKVTRGDPKVAKAIVKAGADVIGDSRLENIQRMKEAGIEKPFMLVRIPMPSEVEEAVKLANIILVSEMETVRKISVEARKLRKIQDVLYMVDVGDLREGVWYSKAAEEIEKIKDVSNVRLYGIGTNLGCYGGVIPDEERMNILISVARKLKEGGLDVPILSGGNTSALPLLEKRTLPQNINEYRIGEGIMLGTDVTNGRKLEYLDQNTFMLQAEVIEVKVKPSVPEGKKIGMDSMGRVPHFEDRGMRTKAILAIGEQDVALDGLMPLEEGVIPLHASSDHAVFDVTNVKRNVRIGDVMNFKLSYSALLRAITSPYVKKVYVESM